MFTEALPVGVKDRINKGALNGRRIEESGWRNDRCTASKRLPDASKGRGGEEIRAVNNNTSVL